MKMNRSTVRHLKKAEDAGLLRDVASLLHDATAMQHEDSDDASAEV